jgi:hypothetical protein
MLVFKGRCQRLAKTRAMPLQEMPSEIQSGFGGKHF